MTTCCDGSILNKKKIKPIDKTKILLAQGQIKINPVAKSTVLPLDQKNQIIVPTKPVSGKEQSILKSNIQVKSDQNRGSHGSIKVLNKNLKPSISNMLQTKSLLTGNNILQNLTLNPSKKIASSLLPTQLIQSPVLHGETLITPPSSRMMVSTKTSNNAGSSCVKVSFTNQTSNLDMSKIPSAKIPHDVQELILRITFPDNKVQFVRLVADGNKCKGAKAFPMPQFNSGGNNGFVEDNLEDSFRLSKMIFDKLSKIKERISSRTKFTEESVFISSANKLHFIYEKSIELLKELDKSLLANFDKWKAETKSTLDVIDLSDEESKSSSGRTLKKLQKSSKFIEKCKEFFPSDDSDIEILDAPEVSYKINKHKSNFRKVMKGQTLNGCSQAYGANFKDKYRFRNLPADNLKPHKKVRNIPAKRKRVGKRKGKRLKPENTNGEKKEEKIEWVSSKSNDESVASLMPNTINSNSVV